METIKMYLDNMFAALPGTPEMQRLHDDLLASMEDKYSELKERGKSENEAIGIVISEFGNIEEITREMHIAPEPDARGERASRPSVPYVERGEVEQFLAENQSCSLMKAAAILLFIASPAMLMFMMNLSGLGGIGMFLGISLLLIFVAAGVAMLIFTDFKLKRYRYLEEDFQLPIHVKSLIENGRDAFVPTRSLLIVLGIMLCVLSPVGVLLPVFVRPSWILAGVGALLMTVAAGVFMLCYAGMVEDGYKKLLKQDEYAPKVRRAEKAIETVGSIYWTLITCIYLLWSFRSGDWGSTWIIWPVTGVLFGAVSAVIHAVYGVKEK